MAIIKTLSVEIEGQTKTLTGGDFYDMLEAVKSIQGRRWDGDRKVWILPISLEDASRILAEDGYTIVGNEDELIDAEISEIERVVARLAENLDLAQEKIQFLEQKISGYSYTSKSRIKSGLMQDCGFIRGAIAALKKPIDALAEIEIRSIKRTLKILDVE